MVVDGLEVDVEWAVHVDVFVRRIWLESWRWVSTSSPRSKPLSISCPYDTALGMRGCFFVRGGCRNDSTRLTPMLGVVTIGPSSAPCGRRPALVAVAQWPLFWKLLDSMSRGRQLHIEQARL